MFNNSGFTAVNISECNVCAADNNRPLDRVFKYLPLVWSRGHCLSSCSNWEKADRKTSSCHQANLFDNFSLNTKDEYSCGDTFYDQKLGEQCEFYTTFRNDGLCSKDC